MLLIFLRKYKTMILFSVFSFYLGCCLTLSFIRVECVVGPTDNGIYLENANSSPAKYVVLVVSSPNNELKRDSIRATWGNFVNNIFTENGEVIYKWNYTWASLQHSQQNVIKLYFAVGTLGLNVAKLQKLRNEQKLNKDILLLNNVHDSYKNLSHKIINALDWFSKNFKEMEYLIKCDDDSFVRIDLIVKDLEAYAPSMNAHEISKFVTIKENLPSYKGLYWGYFNGRAKVYLSGKWQEKAWFLCDNYLPYALGGGYVISRSIVDYISKNIDLLSYYNSEDVSMGVWTASLKAINRVHDIRYDTEWKSRGCDETMLVRHKQIQSDMFQMYKTLVHSQGKKLCVTEDLKRKTYLYNWNVLPSMCCVN